MIGNSRRGWWQAAFVVAFVLFAASVVPAQDITYNAMPGADFTKYKTYKWVKIDGVKYPDQIVDAQIMTAIDKQLATKGLAKATGDQADLAIGYQVAVEQERQWNTMGGYGYGRWGGTGTATSSTINIGTVGVDIYDAAAKQLLWRGAATKTLDTNPSPEKRTKNLDKAMEKLFKKYPPPVKK